ncbi:MAG: EcsC family protein [Pseudomonadota bacterium]|nr:EcsC family protein [Pseudomonadota bacterium]
MNDIDANMAPEDLERLKWATQHLEHPSLAARLTSIVGTPIEIGIKLLPRPVYKSARSIANLAISKALRAAVSPLRHDEEADPRNHYYRVLAAGSGALGGLFGLYALPVEFGLSTTIMMRSIAEIARAEGEDIHSPEAQMACMEVFALGGQSEEDDAADTGYYGIRLALAWPVTHASHYIARHGLVMDGAPALVNLVSAVGSRFGVAVSQKMAAMIVPVIGAAGAAAVNLVFMSHYQEMARGHFVVRGLERKYGPELVKEHYERFCCPDKAQTR